MTGESGVTASIPHHAVVVVGGGQAGLSVSACLRDHAIGHTVLEKHAIGHSWRTQRWDSFCLVTPNWQCKLPGFPYPGADPHGFMPRDEIVAYVEEFARRIDAPVREGVAVERIARGEDGAFRIETSAGAMTADAVVLAISAYHQPNTSRFAERLSAGVVQIHSSAYKNPAQLPPGAVLVVGSGQSGCQIAEDLHLAGRAVHLSTGSAPRCPRLYRGRDAVDWLDDLGQYDVPVERHPKKDGVRRQANHYLTGRDGGRDIDLRRFAREGMRLHGRLAGIAGDALVFADDLAANLDAADAVYNGICATIDKHIADREIAAPPGRRYEPVWTPPEGGTALELAADGVGSVVWATGFRSDFSLVDMPWRDAAGYPTHERGITTVPGVYVIGLPWLHTWGSGRFVGVGLDAAFLVDHLAQYLMAARPASKTLERAS